MNYELELEKPVLMDEKPLVSYKYNKTLKPIIKEININNKLKTIYPKINKIVELLEKHNRLEKLSINKAKYICIYNKSLNILRINNEIVNKINFIIIIDMVPMIYKLDQY